MLAEVQGSFTFSPQQMPHASTYIDNALLEFEGEMPLVSGVRRSCLGLVIPDFNLVIRLTVRQGLIHKSYSDSTGKVYCDYSSGISVLKCSVVYRKSKLVEI